VDEPESIVLRDWARPDASVRYTRIVADLDQDRDRERVFASISFHDIV
jgi:hypothetical protein